MSRPRWSVPRKCSIDGEANHWVMSTLLTSCVARIGESTPMSRSSSTIVPPIVPRGLSLSSLTKKSASSDRLLVSTLCVDAAAISDLPLYSYLTLGSNHP